MGAFVYMLRCADKSLYVGSATGDDLTKRISEHQSGAYPGYTWSRRPVALIWSEHFERITDAIAAERQIKGWSRAKKLALAEGNWISLQHFAQRRAGRPRPSSWGASVRSTRASKDERPRCFGPSPFEARVLRT